MYCRIFGAVVASILVMNATACENRLEVLLQESIGNAHDLSVDVQEECNSDVGSFRSQYSSDFNRLINKMLSLSLQYMVMSGNFGRDVVERPGFQQFFRKLSDDRFDAAKSLIKYAVKRGAFPHRALRVKISHKKPLLDPLPSFGRALNDAKRVFDDMSDLHRRAVCSAELPLDTISCSHDPDVARQLQRYVDEEVTRINTVASHANRLAAVSTHLEQSLGVHLFDTYLAG